MWLSQYFHSSSRFMKMGYRQTTLETPAPNNKLARFQTRGWPDRFWGNETTIFLNYEVLSSRVDDSHSRFQGRMSHPVFKTKTRCSSYVCPGSSCHTYGQNVNTEYQCLYYIVSYYKNLLRVQKGLNSGMDPILPQAVDRGFRTPRRNLHPHTPHLLSSRT
jgi:hypothetical protein